MDPESPWPSLMDGALHTNLLARGMPEESSPEQWVSTHPDILRTLQREFLLAGSQILSTPTLGAGSASLCTRLASITVELAREAGRKAAGVLGPAGLDAQREENPFDHLVQLYREKAAALEQAGVDFFSLEEMASLTEARAGVLACRPFGKPVCVSLALNEDGETLDGGDPTASLLTLQQLGISVFGVSSSAGPDSLIPAVRQLKKFSHVPLAVRPSAGQPNPLLPHLYEIGPSSFQKAAQKLLKAGADILGGGRGTTPAHIAEVKRLLQRGNISPAAPLPEKPEQHNDILLCNGLEFFSLDAERMEFTEPILCESDMADLLLSAEEDSQDLLLIQLDTPEDAALFGANQYLAQLPVCFRSDNEAALARALFLYQGRCLVDSQCEIPRPTLQLLSDRYGAILY